MRLMMRPRGIFQIAGTRVGDNVPRMCRMFGVRVHMSSGCRAGICDRVEVAKSLFRGPLDIEKQCTDIIQKILLFATMLRPPRAAQARPRAASACPPQGGSQCRARRRDHPPQAVYARREIHARRLSFHAFFEGAHGIAAAQRRTHFLQHEQARHRRRMAARLRIGISHASARA